MQFQVGPLHVDADALAIDHAGTTIPTQPKVVELLCALCEHAGAFAAKEVLFERLWSGGYADDATLWQKVHQLRKLLRPYLGPNAVETLPRRGYRLTVPVQRLEPETTRLFDAPIRAERAINGWRAWAGAVAAAFVLAVVVVKLVAFDVHAVPLAAQALQAYNLGDHFLRERTIASLDKAEVAFEAVVHLAPQSALGYAGLTQVLSMRAADTPRLHDRLIRRALEFAEEAVRLEPQSAVARTSLALAMYGDAQRMQGGGLSAARFAELDCLFRDAVALDGTYVAARLYYGEFLFAHGDVDGAYEQVRRSLDLDPSLGAANVMLSQIAYFRGDPAAAVQYATEALGFGAADKWDALLMLGLGYERERKYTSALQAFRELERYAPAMSAAATAYLQAETGHPDAAHIHLRRALHDIDCNCGDFWLTVALVERTLGERESASESFARARNSPIGRTWLAFDPRLGAGKR